MIIVFLNIKIFFYHSSIIRAFVVINNYVHETGPHVPKYCKGLVFFIIFVLDGKFDNSMGVRKRTD